jgi:phosphate transport system protein
MRDHFNRALNDLRVDILAMGDLVAGELTLAMSALETLDADLAKQTFEADKAVNQARYNLEDKCTQLVVTQQPAARDLRAILAVLSMIVDLERMGDQAKGIAKIIPHLIKFPAHPRPPELNQMGTIAKKMLLDSMTAYANGDITLAQTVAAQDNYVDQLYAKIFRQIMDHLTGAQDSDKVEATYEILRAARELERFADLSTNVCERVIYIVTGKMDETNVDRS